MPSMISSTPSGRMLSTGDGTGAVGRPGPGVGLVGFTEGLAVGPEVDALPGGGPRRRMPTRSIAASSAANNPACSTSNSRAMSPQLAP